MEKLLTVNAPTRLTFLLVGPAGWIGRGGQPNKPTEPHYSTRNPR